MKLKVGMVLLLSLLFLSLLVVPVAGAADGGKVLIKEMVQVPGGYGVGCFCFGDFDRMYDMFQSPKGIPRVGSVGSLNKSTTIIC